MNQTKSFTIYIYEVNNRDILNDCFNKIQNPIISVSEVLDAEIKEFTTTSTTCRGFLADLREKVLPHLSKRNDPNERPIPKDNDEVLLEKSHFLYSKSDGILFFQCNAKAFRSPIKLANIINCKFNQTISFNPKLTQDAYQRLLDNKGTIYKTEISVANPDSSVLGNSSLETAIKQAASVGEKIKLSISNDRRKKKFLDTNVVEICSNLFRKNSISFNKFKVYSSELDDPIDLLTERLKFKKNIALDNGGYVTSPSAYQKLEECKDSYQKDNNA